MKAKPKVLKIPKKNRCPVAVGLYFNLYPTKKMKKYNGKNSAPTIDSILLIVT